MSHYLVRKEKVGDVRLGEKVIVLADFSGIPAGTHGIVEDRYYIGDTPGVTVAWQGEEHKNFRGKQNSDGFGENELMFLGFEGFPEELKKVFMSRRV